MIPDRLDHRTIVLALTAYVGITLVTEAMTGDNPTRAASVGLPLLGLAWLALYPGSRPAAARALALASNGLGAASASLARAGLNLGATP